MEINNIHKFPFFCKDHSLEVGCVSYVYGEVSWDVLGHSSNFQYHLENKMFS